jgi:hypothetical protein
MSKKNKAAKQVATKAVPTTNPEVGFTPNEGTKAAAKTSATLIRLTGEYAKNPNAVLRKVNKVYAQKLLNKKMTWEEFCNLKIVTFSQHWEAKKTNPIANKVIKALTAEQKEKRVKELQKLLARAKAMQEALDLPTVEETPASQVADEVSTTSSTNSDHESGEDETEE